MSIEGIFVTIPGEVKDPTSLHLSWTPHSSLEKDNSLNHSCVSPKMGCLEYSVSITKN